MTEVVFSKELDRLKEVYGQRSYPAERVVILFRAVKSMPDFWMEQTVTEFIGNNRTAPLLKEFIEKIDVYQQRKKEEAMFGYGRGATSVNSILNKAAEKTEMTDNIRAYIQLRKDFFAGKLSKNQFFQGCDLIDEAVRQGQKNG